MMHAHRRTNRPTRTHGFGGAIRLLPATLAPLHVRRDPEILVDSVTGCLVRWHLSTGPWPALPPAAIGALRGFHRGLLAPGATWPMHIHEDLQAITYVVAGTVEHADSMGNRGILVAGSVQQRWLGWGTEHQEWNPSATEPAEFIQLWLRTPRPETTAVEQHQHYTPEERLGRWLQIAWLKCWPPDGLMTAEDARVYVTRLNSSSGRLRYRFEPGHAGYVYVVEGDAEVNLERLQTGDAARVLSEGHLHVRAFTPTELLVVDVSVWDVPV